MLSYVTNREISIISFFVFVFVFVFGMISLLITKLHLIIILLYLLQTQVTLSNNFIVFLFFFDNRLSKSISIEECYSVLFYHPKKLLYQLYHTILQYTLHPKTLLFYFFIKILFFNISLLFLSNHHFF